MRDFQPIFCDGEVGRTGSAQRKPVPTGTGLCQGASLGDPAAQAEGKERDLQTWIQYFPFCEPSQGLKYFLQKRVIFNRFNKGFLGFQNLCNHSFG